MHMHDSDSLRNVCNLDIRLITERARERESEICWIFWYGINRDLFTTRRGSIYVTYIDAYGDWDRQGVCVFSLIMLQKGGGGAETLLLFIKLKIWFQVRPGFGNLHIVYMHNTYTHTHTHTYIYCLYIVYSIYLIFVSSASASIQIRVRPEFEPKFE